MHTKHMCIYDYKNHDGLLSAMSVLLFQLHIS